MTPFTIKQWIFIGSMALVLFGLAVMWSVVMTPTDVPARYGFPLRFREVGCGLCAKDALNCCADTFNVFALLGDIVLPAIFAGIVVILFRRPQQKKG